tara:strand:- start:2745 stop:2897 length:153 start_codon:yes stop_codon:yes gene_type:complete
MQRVPYLLVVGDEEVENDTISVRGRGSKDLGVMKSKDFLTIFRKDIERRK